MVFARRKSEGAHEELEDVRSLLTELKGQTSTLQAQVRALEAELAVENRFEPHAYG